MEQILDLFDDPEERRRSVQDFEAVKNTQGWAKMVKIMEQNIDLWRTQLEDPDVERSKKEELKLKLKIDLSKYLIELPDTLLIELSNAERGYETIVGLDPYSRPKVELGVNKEEPLSQ